MVFRSARWRLGILQGWYEKEERGDEVSTASLHAPAGSGRWRRVVADDAVRLRLLPRRESVRRREGVNRMRCRATTPAMLRPRRSSRMERPKEVRNWMGRAGEGGGRGGGEAECLRPMDRS